MYENLASPDLSQGDIVDDCPILVWELTPPPLDLDVPPETRILRVVVLTQACDLAQEKTTRVVVAPVYAAADLVANNILKAGIIRDQVRRGLVFGWYFLPAALAPINLTYFVLAYRRSSGEVFERHDYPPRGYREYMTTLGAGTYCDLVRVHTPSQIRKVRCSCGESRPTTTGSVGIPPTS